MNSILHRCDISVILMRSYKCQDLLTYVLIYSAMVYSHVYIAVPMEARFKQSRYHG